MNYWGWSVKNLRPKWPKQAEVSLKSAEVVKAEVVNDLSDHNSILSTKIGLVNAYIM